MRLDSQICENQPPESPPDKDLKSPQTLQTYSDFKKTLSEGEREAFLKFVEYKTKNYQRKIIDYDDYLSSTNANGKNRYEIYYQEFKKYEKAQKVTNEGGQRYKLRTKYTTEEKQAAIAKFQNRHNRNHKEKETPETQQNERKLEETNRLLDNPPEYEDKWKNE